MRLQDSPIVVKIANDLGLKRFPDAESAIRNYCQRRIKGIVYDFGGIGQIKDLSQLLMVVSSYLQVKFEEIYDDNDLTVITQKYINKGELIFCNLHRELDNETDGILIRLNYAKPWEPKYVAVINCRGNRFWRAYFSKWHEVSHLLILPPSQMEFQFRRTPKFKKSPEEQIVDRVAGDLAFYEKIFFPALAAEIMLNNKLTFSSIERIRSNICIDASREATIRAAVRQVPAPQLFIIAGLGLKKSEETLMVSQQRNFADKNTMIQPKLRALEVILSKEAENSNFRIHKNMRIPHDSVIFKIYEDMEDSCEACFGHENLSWWEHSKGCLDDAKIFVEAKKSGDKVFALVSKI
jgi:hypothetical protein